MVPCLRTTDISKILAPKDSILTFSSRIFGRKYRTIGFSILFYRNHHTFQINSSKFTTFLCHFSFLILYFNFLGSYTVARAALSASNSFLPNMLIYIDFVRLWIRWFLQTIAFYMFMMLKTWHSQIRVEAITETFVLGMYFLSYRLNVI